MKAKRLFFIGSISLVFLMLFVSPVFAQAGGVFQEIFAAIAGESFDMGEFYDNYGNFLDFLIYLTVFISISMATLGKKFETKGGKGVVIAVGIALAIALSSWGTANGFNLRSFGPVAGAIFMMVVFFGIYNLVKNFFGGQVKGKALGTMLSLILVWYLASAVSPALMVEVKKIPVVGPLLSAGFSIILLVFLIMLVLWISQRKELKNVITKPNSSSAIDEIKETEKTEKDEETKDVKEINEELKILKTLKDIQKRLKGGSVKDYDDLQKDMKKLDKELKILNKLEKQEMEDHAFLNKIKEKKTMNDLIGAEKNMYIILDKTIKEFNQTLQNKGKWAVALGYINYAVKILEKLLEINKFELKEF